MGRLPQQNQSVSEQAASVEVVALASPEQFHIAPSRPTSEHACAFSSSAAGPFQVLTSPTVFAATYENEHSSAEAASDVPNASRALTSRQGAGPAPPPHAFTSTAAPCTLWSAQLFPS